MAIFDFREDMTFDELCETYIGKLKGIVEKARKKKWQGFLQHGASFKKITDVFIPLYSQKKPRPKMDEDFERAETEFKLGKKDYYQGKYREAAEHFQNAASLVSKRHSYHGFLGLALKKMGSYDAAVKSFKTAISLYPVSRDYWFNLGECLEALGVKSGAIEAYAIAYLVEPSDFLPIKRIEALDPSANFSGRKRRQGIFSKLFGRSDS